MWICNPDNHIFINLNLKKLNKIQLKKHQVKVNYADMIAVIKKTFKMGLTA